MKYAPEMTESVLQLLVSRGQHQVRPIGPGPCGDLTIYEDRTVTSAVWCSPVCIEGTVVLIIEDYLEVLDRVQN